MLASVHLAVADIAREAPPRTRRRVEELFGLLGIMLRIARDASLTNFVQPSSTISVSAGAGLLRRQFFEADRACGRHRRIDKGQASGTNRDGRLSSVLRGADECEQTRAGGARQRSAQNRTAT